MLGRNTVFTYRGKAVNLERIAKELGVAYVVEGSVRKAGQKVRINAQLIEGSTGGHIWAARYDRDLTDIFTVQDEITHTIVDQLKVKLLPEEKKAIEQAPTGNVEAYTFYLRGREFFHRGSKSNLLLAKQMFAKAIELDPLYARAYAGAADCDSFLYLHYSEGVSIDGILANCATALDIDSGLAEARASRGLALSVSQRYQEAEREFERAITTNPNLFEGHYFYARACFAQGKFEQAARYWERAAEIKPDDYQSAFLLRAVYHSLERPQDATKAARRGVERAQRELERNPSNPRAAYMISAAFAAFGEVTQAKEWAARALSIHPDDILAKYNVACTYSILGELERALDLLVALLPQANHETKAWILHDSDFDPLRNCPRWHEVLELTPGKNLAQAQPFYRDPHRAISMT